MITAGTTSANGTYGLGDVILITLGFDAIVDVTGTPVLELATGGIGQSARYLSGTGSDTLTFAYTVRAGDAASDLDYTGTDALALNGGAIRSAGTDIDLTLPAPGAAGSLSAGRDIAVDGSFGDQGERYDGDETGETIASGAGDDTVLGNGGDDVIYGNLDNDSLDGGAGSDILYGGQGEDTLTGDAGDTLHGGAGNDVIGRIVAGVSVGVGILAYGNLGNDHIVGTVAPDQLLGGQGDDLIEGGAGNDTIAGGLGDDSMAGGEGADTFTIGENAGNDAISDLSEAEGDELVMPEVVTVAEEIAGTVLTFESGGTLLLVGMAAVAVYHWL